MNRILIHDEWYEAIDAASAYESAFASVVMGQATALFPGYCALPFQKTVYSEIESAKPDYALIERGYHHWWVIELEMAHHGLDSHVVPQVTTLCNAKYGSAEAEYVLRQVPTLDRERVFELLKGLPPRVLVVVNRPRPAWPEVLNRLGAELAVFEIYRSDRDRYAYRVEGFLPVAGEAGASLCWLDPVLPAMLKIASPGALPLPRDASIEILWDSRLTRWMRVDARDSVWLVASDRNPLERGKQYDLVCVPDGVLLLRETPNRTPYGR